MRHKKGGAVQLSRAPLANNDWRQRIRIELAVDVGFRPRAGIPSRQAAIRSTILAGGFCHARDVQVGGAMGAKALIGTWKLISWQVVVDGRPQDLFGSRPKGYLILTQAGRSMALTTAQDRTAGESDAARAGLHKTMLAYTGRYRVEGDEFITIVDASWNEAWNGTEQRRKFRIEDDRLIIDSAPAPSILYPGTVDFRRIVWEKEPG
jgi:Lipocalin-like domain